jgi:hypothetical protein
MLEYSSIPALSENLLNTFFILRKGISYWSTGGQLDYVQMVSVELSIFSCTSMFLC